MKGIQGTEVEKIREDAMMKALMTTYRSTIAKP